MKQCIKCKQVKDESKFKKHYYKGKITYRNVCLACYNKYRREHECQAVRHTDNNHKSKVDIVVQFLDACDYNKDNIDTIRKDKFVRCFNVNPKIDFNALKKQAKDRLEDLGYCNPSKYNLTEDGSYLIFGDTFGKKTSSAKFELLRKIADTHSVNAVIHIGHATDDYNDVSNAFDKFRQDVYFIPIKNELKDVHHFCNHNPKMRYNVIRDSIQVGDCKVTCQDHISPYVKTAVSSLDSLIYSGKCIVNCTRHEYFTRTSSKGVKFICSPGAMAEPHVVRIAYKLTLANGGRINVMPVNRDSFLKYRKNDIDKELWEMGCIIVHVKDGVAMPEMVRINVNEDGYACVTKAGIYISNKSIEQIKPEFAILSDVHAPNIDLSVITECMKKLSEAEPHEIIINGDFMDCRSANPHNIYEAMSSDFDSELEHASNLLQWLSKIAPVKLLYGNHEDFLRRFFEQFPQWKTFITKAIKTKLTEYAELLDCNPNQIIPLTDDSKVLHGSAKLFGVNGTQIEKVARSVDRNTIIGHSHSPAIRYGVYCSGCLCDLEQGYNNSVTTNWAHGFILVFNKNGATFIQQILID